MHNPLVWLTTRWVSGRPATGLNRKACSVRPVHARPTTLTLMSVVPPGTSTHDAVDADLITLVNAAGAVAAATPYVLRLRRALCHEVAAESGPGGVLSGDCVDLRRSRVRTRCC